MFVVFASKSCVLRDCLCTADNSKVQRNKDEQKQKSTSQISKHVTGLMIDTVKVQTILPTSFLRRKYSLHKPFSYDNLNSEYPNISTIFTSRGCFLKGLFFLFFFFKTAVYKEIIANKLL